MSSGRTATPEPLRDLSAKWAEGSGAGRPRGLLTRGSSMDCRFVARSAGAGFCFGSERASPLLRFRPRSELSGGVQEAAGASAQNGARMSSQVMEIVTGS